MGKFTERKTYTGNQKVKLECVYSPRRPRGSVPVSRRRRPPREPPGWPWRLAPPRARRRPQARSSGPAAATTSPVAPATHTQHPASPHAPLLAHNLCSGRCVSGGQPQQHCHNVNNLRLRFAPSAAAPGRRLRPRLQPERTTQFLNQRFYVPIIRE